MCVILYNTCETGHIESSVLLSLSASCLYLCHLLEFNSHLTGERRSTEIANDNSSNDNKDAEYTCFCYKEHVK